MRSLPLVRVNLLVQHSTQASNMSMVGTDNDDLMISLHGWIAFFDSEFCSVRCGDEFGLEFN